MESNEQKSSKSLIQNLTEADGLAIVVVDENSKTIAESNNNSMCRVLYASDEFAPHCAEFCGKAFQMTREAGKSVDYQCHAGLNCSAVSLEVEGKSLTAIVGRTFLKAANYRAATERAVSGDWLKFSSAELFENVLLSGSTRHLEKIVGRIENLSEPEKIELIQIQTKESGGEAALRTAQTPENSAEIIESAAAVFDKNREESGEAAVWRSLFSALLELDYREAGGVILDFLSKRYDLKSLMWLERHEDRLEAVMATGELLERKIEIGVAADDERLLDAARREIALELRERRHFENEKQQTINLFPVAVGGQIRSALVVGDELANHEKKRRLAHFCRIVASELEILRLREEISRRDWLTRAVRKFNEGLKKIDTDDFWLNLTQISAELLRAERASLLVYDEKNNVLQTRAMIGADEDLVADTKIGERLAGEVLRRGEPLIAVSAAQIGIEPAPVNRNYKTDSFIIFPIVIGERKIAALSFTDRVGGGSFSEADLELLQAIAPQIAVAVDRADLKTKAGEMEQRSVTDALTGLLNRRYFDERLIEEIKRSNRYGYPMSLLFIDVDNFGRFNKDFGVLIGDEVLRRTVKAMVSTLRGADIAARYGGEEFCVLLPQTTLGEASIIAERTRQSVERIEFPQRQITVSIGVTAFAYDVSTPETIIKTADDALRQAKKSGKNKVRIYGEPNESPFYESSAGQQEKSA